MKEIKRYLITAALPYANGPIHIGHLAGACLPADIYVRYLRSQKRDVLFMGGSDEYGAAIMLKAQKEGVKPQEIVDKFHHLNKDILKNIGVSYDKYHRTTEKLHHQTAQDFFMTLHKKNAFSVEEREQYYDSKYKQFLTDRYIIGTCPKCEQTGAYGDQCEKCGSSLNPTDLINPISILSNQKPILKRTKHWYLPMHDHENWIKKWINTGFLDSQKQHDPKTWKSHVLGQCNSWIDSGLQARAMTRDLSWGIPVPLKEAEGKVFYVWLDAPIGYISATKAWAEENKKDWKRYWKNHDTKLVHFIGKDNIVFHCIIFPILLKLHGDYVLPENVPANSFLNLEGDKISTSRNWAVWLEDYLKDFPEQQDVLRYVLTTLAPENRDSEFTWKLFQEKNNNELLAIFGNFVNRVIILTNKYFQGITPQKPAYNQEDENLLEAIKTIPNRTAEFLEIYKQKHALATAMELARMGNKYLTETTPWTLIKTKPQRVSEILYLSLQVVANLSIILKPFLPFTAKKVEKMLNIDSLFWKDAGQINLIKAGHHINTARLLFKPITDEIVENQLDKLKKSYQSNLEAAPIKIHSSFDNFHELDIRVGTIIDAEKVKKTKKLLKLTVDIGLEKRTIISGVSDDYTIKKLIGKLVCVLVNIPKRKIKGIESEGMILLAEDLDKSLKLIVPEQKTANGAKVV